MSFEDCASALLTNEQDFVRRMGLTAGDDLEQVTQVLGEGANRLRGMFSM